MTTGPDARAGTSHPYVVVGSGARARTGWFSAAVDGGSEYGRQYGFHGRTGGPRHLVLSAAEEMPMSRHPEGGWILPGLITVEAEGDRRILCLRGDIDSAVVARFKEEQGRAAPAIDAIDAGAVSFLSSTGIALLVRCSEAAVAAGRDRPAMRSASRAATRVLELAGLDVSLLLR